MEFTGKVVALVGITLASGVVTWTFSPIKFQADMGILLTFMFIWNMVGAIVLIPALSHFLLNPETARESGRSEEHTSELQSLMRISYAVFCLKKKKHNTPTHKK